MGLWLQSSIIGVTIVGAGHRHFCFGVWQNVGNLFAYQFGPHPYGNDLPPEVGQIGQNYLRSLFAVGFQGLLILVCVAIYAVLIQGIATAEIPSGRYGAPWAIRFCSASCCSKPGRLHEVSLAHIEKRGVICREDMGPTGRACGTGKRRRTSTRRCLPLYGGNRVRFAKAGIAGRQG